MIDASIQISEKYLKNKMQKLQTVVFISHFVCIQGSLQCEEHTFIMKV